MNPYANRTMIKDPAAFVGRSDELQEIFNLLASMQSCSIVGPRRIGKSSLLYHLTRPDVYSPFLPDPKRHIFVFLDLQELAGLGQNDFFGTIVERISRTHREKLAIDFERDGSPSGFRRLLGRITDEGLRLVLCCDEFEMLSRNQSFTVDFFTYLRGLCSNYSLALVTSSQASLFDLCHQGNIQTSQFWNIFTERSLGLMPEPEARQLSAEPFARFGGGITIEEQAFILELSGYHPLFIQIACYYLFESRITNTRPDLIAIEQRFFEEARRHYIYEWERLEEINRRILATAVHTRKYSFPTAFSQRLKRRAVLNDAVQNADPLSRGWRRFIKEQSAEIATNSLPTLGPIKPSEAQPISDIVGRGTQLGQYEVLDLLGRGGMGVVYKGRHLRLERAVAIKVLSGDLARDPDFCKRFEREARAVASLRHPNIVQIFDFGDMNGFYYMIMEYIAGSDLAGWLQNTSLLSLSNLIPLAQQIANALDYAHAQGIIHRDVKPSNIMLEAAATPEAIQNTLLCGFTCRAVLTDFGIAKILAKDYDPSRSGLMGTLYYSAPELIQTPGKVDGRVDIYAFGIMVYKMLTGQMPFTGESPGAVLMAHLHQPTPDPRELTPTLSESAARAIQRAMAKDPQARFPTAREFVDSLSMQ
jgi:serine/threonine protein kinase